MGKRISFKGLSLHYFLHDDLNMPVHWQDEFKRDAPLYVEIGFGTGEYLVQLAQKHPEINFVGIEQCWKRTVKALRKITEAQIHNVRLLKKDAWEVFEWLIQPKTCAQIHCLFPCPWPKDRHEHHRLFSTEFLTLINSRLANNGQMYFVSDHYPYVDWILEGLPGTGFRVDHKNIPAQFNTKFEKRWVAQGQGEFAELTFSKDKHIDVPLKKEIDVKSYTIDHFNADEFDFKDIHDDVAITIKDILFDAKREKAILQFVVNEENLTQHVCVIIVKQQDKWRMCLAKGIPVLSSPGVKRLLEEIYKQCKP